MGSHVKKLSGKAVKPSPRSLLKTINSLMQQANMMRLRMILIPRWLTHVDLLLQHPMKKGIGNIQLP